MNAIKMVLKINVNTTITMITWSDWPTDSVCNQKEREQEVERLDFSDIIMQMRPSVHPLPTTVCKFIIPRSKSIAHDVYLPGSHPRPNEIGNSLDRCTVNRPLCKWRPRNRTRPLRRLQQQCPLDRMGHRNKPTNAPIGSVKQQPQQHFN